MKKVVAYTVYALIAVMLCGCNVNVSHLVSGDGVYLNGSCTEEDIDFSEERTVARFEDINVSGPFNVHFMQSDACRVLVEGKEEFVSNLLTEVRDEELFIRLKPGKYENPVLRVTVWAPVIEDLVSRGGGNIICGDIDMSMADISLSSAGSGDILAGNITCNELVLSMAGSGDAKFSGKISVTDDFDAAIAGSGDITLSAVECNEAGLSSAGSGSLNAASIRTQEDLSVSLAGSGDAFIGNVSVGKDMKLKIAGSGDINVNGECGKLETTTLGSGNITGNVKYTNLRSETHGSGKVSL